MHNSVIPCNLTPDQKQEVKGVLVQAEKIVRRVSTLAYGQPAIRDFRRDLAKGILDKYLTGAEKVTLREVESIQSVVTQGFFKMVHRIATNRIRLGQIYWEVEDLIQEGLEAILLAMMGYNGETELTTYFWHVVSRHFTDLTRQERRAKCDHAKSCSLGEMDLPASQDENVELNCDYETGLLRYAIKCVRLTNLEKVVLKSVMEGGASSGAACQVENPATGKPFSRESGHHALKSAWVKIDAVYQSLLVREAA